MRRSGDKGAIPVMSRTGKVTINKEVAFLDKPRLPERVIKEETPDFVLMGLAQEDMVFNETKKRLNKVQFNTFK